MSEIEIGAEGVVRVNGSVVGRVDRHGAHKRNWLFTDLQGRQRVANNQTALQARIMEAASAAKEGQ